MSTLSLRSLYGPRFSAWVGWKRVANVNANQRLRSYVQANTAKSWSAPARGSSSLRVFEDRREYNPEGDLAPARSFSYPRHRLKTVTPRSGVPSLNRSIGFEPVPIGVGFANPSKVLICVRRKMRREVMFARGHAGRAGNQFKHRTNEYSGVRC